MKTLKQTLVRGAVAVMTAICGIACVVDDYPDYYNNDYYSDGVDVELSLQMLYGGSTRGGATRADASLQCESVEQLRVVIVSLPFDSNGKQLDPSLGEEPFVEVNMVLERVTFDRAGQHLVRFSKIRSDRRKRVFLLANCESKYLNLKVDDETVVDLDDSSCYLPPENQKTYIDYVAPIENCRFSALKGTWAAAYKPGVRPDPSSNNFETGYRIPITAMHDIAVPTVDYLRSHITDISPELTFRVPSPLYMVRAVNKVDFEVINNTGNNSNSSGSTGTGSPGNTLSPMQVRLKSFTISQVCDGESFLFAKFDTNTGGYAEREQNRFFGTYDTESDEPLYERTDLNPAWMQWLKVESSKVHEQPLEDEEDDCQWLQSYMLPGAPDYRNVAWSTDFDEVQSPWAAATNGAVTSTAPVYFPETIYNVTPETVTTANGSEIVKKQHYKLKCTFEMRENDNDNVITFETDEVDLPHLASLFRNTHVKIRVTVNDSAQVNLQLIVMPWTMAPIEEWSYERVVGITGDGWLKWDRGTYEWNEADANPSNPEDNNTYRLVMKPDNNVVAVGRFTIASPVNDEWYAFLIPISGDPDAFFFANTDAEGKPVIGANGLIEPLGENPHGIIDGETEAVIYIGLKSTTTIEQNAAKLQIMVRTADNRYLEANVCSSDGPLYYTLIQNRNDFL